MTAALLLIASAAVSALGFGLIAISQAQHRGLVGKQAPALALRIAGSLLIGLAAAPAVMRDGLSLGLLLWATLLTVSATLVVGLLAWLRRRDGHR